MTLSPRVRSSTPGCREVIDEQPAAPDRFGAKSQSPVDHIFTDGRRCCGKISNHIDVAFDVAQRFSHRAHRQASSGKNGI